MGYNAGPPPNDQIDYDRAGRLEAAIRQAARENGFVVLKISVRTHTYDAPTMDVELQQRPQEARP
jgi:hypothetical protein